MVKEQAVEIETNSVNKKVKLVYRSLDKQFILRKLVKKVESVGQTRRYKSTAPASTEELLALDSTSHRMSPRKKRKEPLNSKDKSHQSPQRKKKKP
jgi:hypothetical protein